MKFDTKEKDAEVIGDIKSNAVSIDTSNINFIVTILSTNLYSKPIESFIRETVSNAWDSHVEAGITEPVILELNKDTEGNYSCRVQDFGVGLSPERFNDIYRNIGSSTKRNSNNQIGGFGIGRFSALAYSDVVHITSNFDGIQYKYMMYKDGNSISIDLLHEEETEERNGVSVQLELKNNVDIANFYNAIKKQLVYFENLYFVDNTESGFIPNNEFNSFHIKKYDDFLVNSLDNNTRTIDLVLGKVRYPLRIEALTKKYPAYVSQYPISLKFEIGDLEVTPNREELSYSQKNIEKIELVLDSAIEKIDEIFEAHSNKDFDNLTDYTDAIRDSHAAPLLEVDGEKLVYIKIPSDELKVTLNGKKYAKKNFLKLYDYIMGTVYGVPYNYTLSYDKLVYGNSTMSLNTLKDLINHYYICDVSTLNAMSKSYIRDKFVNNTKFVSPNISMRHQLRFYFKKVKEYSKKGNYNDVYYDGEIVKTIIKLLLLNLKNLKKFSDANVPQSFIDQKKADAKAKRALYKNAGVDWTQNINIDELRTTTRGTNNVTTDTSTHSLSDVKKKYTKLTVYGEKGSTKLRALFNITRGNSTRVNLIEVAPLRMKLIKDFQNFVNIEDIMNVKYKLIRQIATAKLIEETLPYLSELATIEKALGKISTNLQTVVTELNDYKQTYLSGKFSIKSSETLLIDDIYKLCQDNNYFDEDMKATLNNNLELLKSAQAILMFAAKEGHSYEKKISDDKINLVVDYILARKLFRPDIPAVFKLKQETIFNIKKDEDNKD